MKKAVIAMLLISVVLLTGCILNVPEGEITTLPDDGMNTTTVFAADITTVQNAEASEMFSEPQTGTTVAEETTAADVHTTKNPSENLNEETTTEQSHTDQEEINSENTITEIELTIEMPDKNGNMKTDTSPNNKFIKAVNSDRMIETDKLVAVFAVPESGQNYVFEFYDSDGRDVDDLRRVYLLDSDCKITGVAATSAKEKESVSSVENWFCMNVLIKEIIFPAIADSFE